MTKNSNYQSVESFWYKKVPSSWTKTKNKYIFKQNKFIVGKEWDNFTLLTLGKSGVRPRNMDSGGKFPDSFETYQKVNPKNIIFCLFDLDETPRTVGLSEDYGMITSAYDVFSTNEKNHPQFWFYFYLMIDDQKGLRPYYTGLRKVVRYETFMGIEVFAPPLREQQLIAIYLEKKTEQMNSLISKIENKIELLKEKRRSLINYYVTKGIENNADMKDSGVDWIGKIPFTWEVKKLKYLASEILEKRKSNSKDIRISPENVESNSGKIVNYYADYEGDGKVFLEGDILFNKLRVYLNKVIFCQFQGLSMGEMIVIRPKYIFGEFLHKVLSSSKFIDHINSFSQGVKVPRSPIYRIFDSYIPLPRFDEQEGINNLLKNKLEIYDHLIEKYILRIKLIKENSQSLIYSVVTGNVRITDDML